MSESYKALYDIERKQRIRYRRFVEDWIPAIKKLSEHARIRTHAAADIEDDKINEFIAHDLGTLLGMLMDDSRVPGSYDAQNAFAKALAKNVSRGVLDGLIASLVANREVAEK